MELNKKQIEYLFKFVEDKGVKYYDVQHEIVDHLASSIEEEMTTNTNLTFEQSLDLVYGRYPITGFGQYTQELEKSLQIFWLRKLMSMFTVGYGVPLIGFVLTIFLIMYLSIGYFGIVATKSWFYFITGFAILALVLFGKSFGKSSIEMMLYFGYIITKDDLNKRLLYYNVLKVFVCAIIFIPLVLSRFSYLFLWDSVTNAFNAGSSSVILYSLLGSVSLCFSAAIIFLFPNLLKDVIRNKYSHVAIA